MDIEKEGGAKHTWGSIEGLTRPIMQDATKLFMRYANKEITRDDVKKEMDQLIETQLTAFDD